MVGGSAQQSISQTPQLYGAVSGQRRRNWGQSLGGVGMAVVRVAVRSIVKVPSRTEARIVFRGDRATGRLSGEW